MASVTIDAPFLTNRFHRRSAPFPTVKMLNHVIPNVMADPRTYLPARRQTPHLVRAHLASLLKQRHPFFRSGPATSPDNILADPGAAQRAYEPARNRSCRGSMSPETRSTATHSMMP